jgi:hypothetical protein
MFWGARYVDAGDLDGDGDTDLVGASELTDGVWEQDGDITWFENLDGNGTVWEQHELEWDRNSSEAHIVDLDGDGDLDVVGGEQGRICWWENRNGDASEWLQRFVETGLDSSSYLDIGDIDNDGDLDLIGGAYHTDYIIWWENTVGDGTVWQLYLVAGASNVSMIALRDLDGDGDLDAATALGLSGGAAYWLENLSGDGLSWDAWLITGAVDGYVRLAIADVNDDSRLDAVVSHEGYASGAAQLVWFDLTEFRSSGELVSSVLDGGGEPVWDTIAWNAAVPPDATLAVAVRASDDPYNLGPFVDVPASGADLATLITPNARYFQYKLDLATTDEAVSPTVEEVSVGWRIPGDLNCDGAIDFDDIDPFVLALSGEDAYYAAFPDCHWMNADADADGSVDFNDIDAFVALLGS